MLLCSGVLKGEPAVSFVGCGNWERSFTFLSSVDGLATVQKDGIRDLPERT